MFEIFLIVVATLVGGGGAADVQTAAVPAAEAPPAASGQPGDAATPGAQARAIQGYSAEPQTATGKFTTALEVKPILTATKGNWVAVRDWDGQDLLYVTHLMAWRCGLVAMHVGINGEAAQAWALPECHEDTAVPNALLEQDGLPYKAYPRGSIETITVELTYDDLSTDSAYFERKAVLLP